MNRSTTRARMLAGAIALAALTGACGLKSEATQSLKGSGGNGTAGTTAGTTAGGGAGTSAAGGGGAGVVGTGSGSGSLPSGSGTGGSALGTSTGSSTASGGSTTGSSGGGTGSGGGTAVAAGTCGTPHGGTTTGITASTINLGLHAPLTGTGTPFPNSSFEAGAGTFWKQPGHTVCGRKVTVEFQDDTYTPSGARTVCSEMAKRDFFVVGGGGTDQIQACATDPQIQQLGVPYLSAGVTTNGLTSLNNYFAVSLSYAQQSALVVRNAVAQGFAHPKSSNQASDNIKGKNAVWAVVTADTKNFADAQAGIDHALTAAGIPYKNFPVSQNGNYQAAAEQLGGTLALDGFGTIYFDAAPGYFVFATQGYYDANGLVNPNWVGPGVTYTEVTVAQYVCSTTKTAISGHAWFLAPAPGIDRATSDFKQAYGGKYDDIEWSLWGLSNSLWDLLKDASGNLTRQNFIASTENAVVPGGVYPPIDYKDHGGHFGGTAAWVQKVNCGQTEPDQNQPGEWDTVGNAYLNLY